MHAATFVPVARATDIDGCIINEGDYVILQKEERTWKRNYTEGLKVGSRYKVTMVSAHQILIHGSNYWLESKNFRKIENDVTMSSDTLTRLPSNFCPPDMRVSDFVAILEMGLVIARHNQDDLPYFQRLHEFMNGKGPLYAEDVAYAMKDVDSAGDRSLFDDMDEQEEELERLISLASRFDEKCLKVAEDVTMMTITTEDVATDKYGKTIVVGDTVETLDVYDLYEPHISKGDRFEVVSISTGLIELAGRPELWNTQRFKKVADAQADITMAAGLEVGNTVKVIQNTNYEDIISIGAIGTVKSVEKFADGRPYANVFFERKHTMNKGPGTLMLPVGGLRLISNEDVTMQSGITFRPGDHVRVIDNSMFSPTIKIGTIGIVKTFNPNNNFIAIEFPTDNKIRVMQGAFDPERFIRKVDDDVTMSVTHSPSVPKIGERCPTCGTRKRPRLVRATRSDGAVHYLQRCMSCGSVYGIEPFFSKEIQTEIRARNIANPNNAWGAYVFKGSGEIKLGPVIVSDSRTGVSVDPEIAMKDAGIATKEDVLGFMLYFPDVDRFSGWNIGCPFRRAIERNTIEYGFLTYQDAAGNTIIRIITFPGSKSWDYMKDSNPGLSKKDTIERLLNARDGKDTVDFIDWDAFIAVMDDNIETMIVGEPVVILGASVAKKSKKDVVIQAAMRYWRKLSKTIGIKMPKDVAECAAESVVDSVFDAWDGHHKEVFKTWPRHVKEWFDVDEVIHLALCCAHMNKPREGACKAYDQVYISRSGESAYDDYEPTEEDQVVGEGLSKKIEKMDWDAWNVFDYLQT